MLIYSSLFFHNFIELFHKKQDKITFFAVIFYMYDFFTKICVKIALLLNKITIMYAKKVDQHECQSTLSYYFYELLTI